MNQKSGNHKKVIALIPLKGKSKSIPRKNIKILAGKPLCYWVCLAAAKSKYIDEIYVSTEDKEIAQIVQSFGFNIKVIPEKLVEEKNRSVLESVIKNFMKYVSDFDLLVTIQATSPLTTSAHIDSALEAMEKNKFDSLLSGVLFKKFYWARNGKPLNYDFKRRPTRQAFEGTITESGAFWITKKKILIKEKNRLGGKIGIFEMPKHTIIDIDEPSDWIEIEKLLLEQPNMLNIK